MSESSIMRQTGAIDPIIIPESSPLPPNPVNGAPAEFQIAHLGEKDLGIGLPNSVVEAAERVIERYPVGLLISDREEEWNVYTRITTELQKPGDYGQHSHILTNEKYTRIVTRYLNLAIDYGDIVDPSVVDYIQSVAKRLFPNKNVDIIVTNYSGISLAAAAVGDNTIVLNKRELGKIKNEAELAFVLAHAIVDLQNQGPTHMALAAEMQRQRQEGSRRSYKHAISAIARENVQRTDVYALAVLAVRGYNITAAIKIIDRIRNPNSRIHPSAEDTERYTNAMIQELQRIDPKFSKGIVDALEFQQKVRDFL